MVSVLYATREQVQESMEMVSTPRANRLTDQKIGAATRMIEGTLRRRFYPKTQSIRFDWPNYQYGPTWTLYFDDNEFISLSSVVSGGTTLDPSTYFLRRSDDRDEPPYDMLQINLGSAGAFNAGTTFQRSLVVSGDTGFNATDTSLPAAVFTSAATDTATSIVVSPSDSLLNIGVGSLLLAGTERMIVTDRFQESTGYLLQSDIDDETSAAIIDVTNGAAFAAGETILIDAERMHIDEISGNNLIVTRAWDGTGLATHAQSAPIYALRRLRVVRGALGTTAAAHSQGVSIYAHQFAEGVNELCIAESVVLLEQNASAYSRQPGSGANARKSGGEGLEDIRNQMRITYGRGRLEAV